MFCVHRRGVWPCNHGNRRIGLHVARNMWLDGATVWFSWWHIPATESAHRWNISKCTIKWQKLWEGRCYNRAEFLGGCCTALVGYVYRLACYQLHVHLFFSPLPSSLFPPLPPHPLTLSPTQLEKMTSYFSSGDLFLNITRIEHFWIPLPLVNSLMYSIFITCHTLFNLEMQIHEVKGANSKGMPLRPLT